MNSPQSQKEVAKLIQALKELLTGLGALFQKDRGRSVVKMNEQEMANMHKRITDLAEEQRELADEYKDKGEYTKAAYLNARAKVMDVVGNEISPDKLHERSLSDLDVSPEAFEIRFRKELDKAIEEIEADENYQKSEHTIDFQRMDINDMQKLDQKLVESKFNYGSRNDKAVFAGLATGANVLHDKMEQANNKSFAAAHENEKGLKMTNPDGSPYEKPVYEPAGPTNSPQPIRPKEPGMG